jgi:hypothetical protein
MNTQISSKLVALAAALMMNSLIIGAVAYMFNSQVHQTTFLSVAHRSAATPHGAA